jgi:hypothetical protein
MTHTPSTHDPREPLRDALTDTVAPKLADGDYTVTVRLRVQSGSVTAWSPPRVTRQE